MVVVVVMGMMVVEKVEIPVDTKSPERMRGYNEEERVSIHDKDFPLICKSSTSNWRDAFAGITGGKPRVP